jgi:hypothetical protein
MFNLFMMHENNSTFESSFNGTRVSIKFACIGGILVFLRSWNEIT